MWGCPSPQFLVFTVELRRCVSIPKETQDRILAAAAQLNYRPNLFGRSLRNRRSKTIEVLMHEVSEGYTTLVLSGIEHELLHGAPAVANNGHPGGSNGVAADWRVGFCEPRSTDRSRS
jgi:hypothetical protein